MTSKEARLKRLATAETGAFTLLELFVMVVSLILLEGLLLPALFAAIAPPLAFVRRRRGTTDAGRWAVP
jgi:hypothetical protein